jgi:16S rRNA (guanine966-N2)-methyltransferase
MRIIAGDAKGRVLRTPGGKSTRPTDSRARETLFNILGERVLEARVLDLYAGSGAVGLEALSRGAKTCVFVEQNAGAADAIRTNLKTLGWDARAQVWNLSFKSALHRMSEKGEYSGGFDIVFADPPFDEPREFEDLRKRVDILARLLHNVGEFAESIQAPHAGLAVIQHPQRASFTLAAPFALWKARRSGHSCLSFFELSETVETKQETKQETAEDTTETEPRA